MSKLITLSFAAATLAELNGSILAYAAALPSGDTEAKPTTGKIPPPANASGPSATAAASASTSEPLAASPSDAGGENAGKTDAAGTVFDPARHTGTIVKSGLWRMKTGLSRPEHEGESAIPKAGTETKTPPPPPGAKTPPPPPAKPAVDPNRPSDPAFIHDNGDGTELWFVNDAWDEGHPVPGAAVEEDDEFAAFATAGKPETAQARSWTDADLSKLCNDAAVKDGGPTKVKPIIAKYIPEGQGQTQHSRNIPQAQREAFAQEIEAACGITFEPA